MGLFVFNSNVQLPLPPILPFPTLSYHSTTSFKGECEFFSSFKESENFCCGELLLLFGLQKCWRETRLRYRRRLPLLWSWRSKSGLQSHSTAHSKALFICVHLLPRSSLRAKVAVVYSVKLVHSSCSIIIYGKGE